MKLAPLLLSVLVLLGCANATKTFEGWSVRDAQDGKLVVQVGHVWSDRSQEALFYAALMAKERGHHFFAIQEEDGHGQSGTRFTWRKNEMLLTHGNNPPFLSDFSPGSFFTIVPAGAAGEKSFDSEKLVAAFKRWRKENFP